MDIMGGLLKGRSHLVQAFEADTEVDCADVRAALKAMGLSTAPNKS
jgi:hypothetical protein